MTARQGRGAGSRLSICVVGGGIAGLATALRLQADGHRLTLLAGMEAPPPPEAGDSPARLATDAALRCYALSPASTALLTGLGAAAGLEGACGYRAMRVWGGSIGDALGFDLGDAPFGTEALGHITRHDRLHHALWQLAQARLDLRPERATALNLAEDDGAGAAAELECADGELVTADLVVAADGSRSPLRTQAGIVSQAWDYEQRGIVANVHCERGLDATAWQRFLPSGPLAFLPLDAEHASIVWSADNPVAAELLAADDEHFGAALTEASQGVLGQVRLCGRRLSFPLVARQAQRYHRGRLVLVGDAARVIHPLAGQGLNLGLADGNALALALSQYPARGGAHRSRALAAYNRRRRTATADMLAVTDGLYRLFGPAGEGLAELRNAGMALVNRLPPARGWLVARALGLAE